MELVLILQISFIAAILIINLIFILIPLKIIPRGPNALTSSKSARVISLCNCFSGGVFLGVCNMQLTPYVNSKLLNIFHQVNVSSRYCMPLTQCLVMFGFLLVLFIEQIVKLVRGSHDEYHTLMPGEVVNLQSLTPNGWPVTSDDNVGSDESDDEVDTGEDKHMIPPRQKKRSTHTRRNGRTDASASHYDESNHSGHGHSHLGDLAFGGKFDLRSFLLFSALSLHSLFEGLAVGLQDDVIKLVNLFIGVALHEILVAFSVGINLAQQKLKLATIIKLSVFFSLIIPIGMVIGLLVGTAQNTFAGQLSSAIIQGIAGGTFLFVIFMEILPTEINNKKDPLLKFFFILMGLGIISALSFSTADHL